MTWYTSLFLFSLFFFFQAEDGIRDYKVTGVQTCALPIYDRLAIRRRLRDLTHGQIAVDRQRERARDRRRRHVQHVRRAVLGKRRPLLDAEPVLLVDDGHRKIGELDVALDQRVRPDRDLRDTVRDLVAD